MSKAHVRRRVRIRARARYEIFESSGPQFLQFIGDIPHVDEMPDEFSEVAVRLLGNLHHTTTHTIISKPSLMIYIRSQQWQHCNYKTTRQTIP